MRIRQAAATKEHEAVVNAVGRFMKVQSGITILLVVFELKRVPYRDLPVLITLEAKN